jgi:hypothetical protein
MEDSSNITIRLHSGRPLTAPQEDAIHLLIEHGELRGPIIDVYEVGPGGASHERQPGKLLG